MPGDLLKTYKEQNDLLKKLEKAQVRLEEKGKAIKPYLEQEEKLYEERRMLTTTMVGLFAESSDPQTTTLQEKLNQIDSQIPWVNSEQLTTQYLTDHKVKPSDFNAYMDALAESRKIATELNGKCAYIANELLPQTTNADEKKKAIEWSLTNNKPLTLKTEANRKRLMGPFPTKLYNTYLTTAESYCAELGDPKYKKGLDSHKYHLNDLETAVEKQRAKQSPSAAPLKHEIKPK